jgi:hypothetical protein
MKRFWEWMRDKALLSTHELSATSSILISEKGVIYKDNRNNKTYEEQLPKQMLIGYMIEYIREHGRFIGMVSNKGFETIEEYYNRLKNFINDREEE